MNRTPSPKSSTGLIAVVLVDDHTLVRSGIRRVIEDARDLVVVAETSSAASAVALSRQLQPDVIVLDYVLPDESGLVALQRIRQTQAEVAVLMLTMRDDPVVIRACLDAGASGFVAKSAIDVDLADAVRRVARGGRVVVPELRGGPSPSQGAGRLTPREQEVLTLICRGRSARDVARELGLSVFTVRAHRANIMRALGVRRTMSLVTYAVRRGLVDLP